MKKFSTLVQELTMADVERHKEHIKAVKALHKLRAKIDLEVKKEKEKEIADKHVDNKKDDKRRKTSTKTDTGKTPAKITFNENTEGLEVIYNLAKKLNEEDKQQYLRIMLAEYPQQERKKTFLAFTVENNCEANSHLFESLAGKALISGMFLRLRGKLTTNTKPVDQVKAIADMVALSALYTSQSFKEVMKQIEALKTDIKNLNKPNNMVISK